MALISKSEFARTAGVSRQSIDKAIKAGRIALSGEGRRARVDLESDLTLQYLRDDSDQRRRAGEQKENHNSKTAPPAKAGKDSNEIFIPQSGTGKQSAEIDRIKATTANLHIKLAEQMKILVLREKVNKTFGNMASILLNHFHPLGDRLAPILAGIFGTNDQEKILEAKKKIDSEVIRGLQEFKRISIEETK